MPWQISDVDRFKQGLTASQKRQWVAIANSILAKCLEDGGEQDECEASAIRQANGAVKTQEIITMAIRHGSETKHTSPVWGTVDKTKLPRQAFADQGEEGKKSTWKYPHHWVSGGKMYLHPGGLNAAWAAAHGARTGKRANPFIVAHLSVHRRALGLTNLVLMEAVKTNMPMRREEYEGREHIIVPVVALVEGVHNRLLYPADEISVATEAWNGMPVTVQHPVDDKGISVPASTPEIIAAQKVGRFFNAVFEDNKLKGELWLDTEKTKKLSPEVLEIINADGQLDVSTGLFTTDEESSGEWNGEEYDAITRSHLPNHLALLPGGEGACNWDDGCGVRANEAEEKGLGNFVLKKVDLKKLNDKGDDNNMPEIEDQLALLGDEEVRKDKGKLFNLFSTLAKKFGLKTEEASYEDIRGALQGFVDDMDRPTAPQEGQYHYVKEVFDGYFIYEKRSQGQATVLFKQSYVTDEEGKTELEGQPEEVIEETTYKLKNQEKDKEVAKIMAERKEQVDKLISNEENPFCEDSREYLMKISDEVFEQVKNLTVPVDVDAAVAKALEDKAIQEAADLKAQEEADAEAVRLEAEANEDPDKDKPITMESYLEKAPVELKGTLERAVAADKRKKDDLVKALVENKRNKFSQEDLENRSIVELENLAALGDVPVKDYSVKSGAPEVKEPKKNERQEDGSGVPDMPVMKFEKKK